MLEVKKQRIITQILGRPYKQGKEFLYPSRCCGHHKNKLSINFLKNVAKCWICDWKTKNLASVAFRWGNRQQKQAWMELDTTIAPGELDNLFQEEAEHEQQEEVEGGGEEEEEKEAEDEEPDTSQVGCFIHYV